MPDLFLEALYQKSFKELDFNDGNPYERERQRLQFRNELAEIMGIGRIDCASRDLNVQVLESVKMQGYIRERVSFDTADNLEMLAYVLIPEKTKGKLPAIVACHGHGYGSRSVVGLTPEGLDNSSNPDYHRNFAIELVKRGFLVIVPELLGFGDRRMEEDSGKPLGAHSCYHLSTYLLTLGLTTAGLRVFEIMRTIDYLAERDDVDDGRIGCMGISGGGLVCGFSSALDTRIKAAVVSAYTNTFKEGLLSLYHCVDNFIPGVLLKAELPDILGLVAPRALLIEAGTKDSLFPIEGVNHAYDRLSEIYGLMGAESRLDRDIFEGDHWINGAKAYEWFERYL
jgi:dienelactone hydrolase